MVVVVLVLVLNYVLAPAPPSCRQSRLIRWMEALGSALEPMPATLRPRSSRRK
jgi:hypothetical protein